jgi:ribosomal protein S18 acetylase RimI-like enzyme
MTDKFRIKQVESSSPFIDRAAALHVECLGDTLTSTRGAPTVAGIYRRLLCEGHALHLALDGETVIGGVMVMLHGIRRANLFAATYRPWSWLAALARLGVRETLSQLVDVAGVMRHTWALPPHDYIVAVYVDERARRLGVARSLIAAVSADSTRRGVGVAVDTLRGNDAARRLYVSIGFREHASTTRSQMFSRVSE